MNSQDPALIEVVLAEVSVLGNMLRSRTHANTFPPKAANLLLLLHEHGQSSVPQLARRCRTTRQNTQVIVNSLLRSGFVRTAANPAHKRSPLVELTKEGLEKLASVEANKAEVAKKLGGACTDAELQLTLRTLAQIQNAFRTADREQHAPEERRRGEVVERERPSPVPQPNEELPVSLL